LVAGGGDGVNPVAVLTAATLTLTLNEVSLHISGLCCITGISGFTIHPMETIFCTVVRLPIFSHVGEQERGGRQLPRNFPHKR
jgi:hypothetical protein